MLFIGCPPVCAARAGQTLGPVDAGVQPVAGAQLGVRPLLENAATVQHHHEIGLGKGQQAVREQTMHCWAYGCDEPKSCRKPATIWLLCPDPGPRTDRPGSAALEPAAEAARPVPALYAGAGRRRRGCPVRRFPSPGQQGRCAGPHPGQRRTQPKPDRAPLAASGRGPAPDAGWPSPARYCRGRCQKRDRGPGGDSQYGQRSATGMSSRGRPSKAPGPLLRGTAQQALASALLRQRVP